MSKKPAVTLDHPILPRRYLRDIGNWALTLAGEPCTSSQAAELGRIVIAMSLAGHEFDDLPQAIAAAIGCRIAQCRQGTVLDQAIEKLLGLVEGVLEGFHQQTPDWQHRLRTMGEAVCKVAEEWPGLALREESHGLGELRVAVVGMPADLPQIFHDDPFVTPKVIAALRKKKGKGKGPKGKPGRRGYPLEALGYALKLRGLNPMMKASKIRGECLKRFSEHELPPDGESFRAWLNRKRTNRTN